MTDSRLTVGEERLRQLFAEFKLDLLTELAKKASIEAHDLLAHRVMQLEIWQAGVVATDTTKREFSARQLAVRIAFWTIAATFLAGVIAAVATLVWLAVG